MEIVPFQTSPLQLVASLEVVEVKVVAPLLRNDTLEIVLLTNHIRYRMLSNVLPSDPLCDNHEPDLLISEPQTDN